MKYAITFVFFFSLFGLLAQNELAFNKATKAYNEGNYEEAITYYQEILDSGQHSAALYFNLGNSYYKLNEIAPSIYNYEKALLLAPGDREIIENLEYARNMTLDDIDEVPQTGISRFVNSVTGQLSFDQWAVTAIIFGILFVLLYIAFYFFRFTTQKRVSFISSLVALFLCILSLIFAYVEYLNYKADNPAIIFKEEVVVRSEPNQRSTEAFVLHEGTKVQALETLEDWQKIRLSDGKTGWVPEDVIQLLKDY
ncbi:tetratricopeptide repeat protein [Zeaxanthinibacter sp. PT1]|uniref:tetratricopeptide repeat protein n=1 Tax=Zeaxanthinibacter TaxID=561554 RepID=UPI002349D0D1|nr:SH3 domain-containing protein [Zeaxanthinibacter sp. PT1]MDC6350862.1 tetratricopeptide repeat protein [Zeaxanthinibacter sp. PT1]